MVQRGLACCCCCCDTMVHFLNRNSNGRKWPWSSVLFPPCFPFFDSLLSKPGMKGKRGTIFRIPKQKQKVPWCSQFQKMSSVGKTACISPSPQSQGWPEVICPGPWVRSSRGQWSADSTGCEGIRKHDDQAQACCHLRPCVCVWGGGPQLGTKRFELYRIVCIFYLKIGYSIHNLILVLLYIALVLSLFIENFYIL